MNFLLAVFCVTCLVAVGCLVSLLFSLSKATTVAKRTSVKRLMSVVFGVTILCFAFIGVAMVWDSVTAQASGSGDAMVRVSDYSLATESFEFRSPEFGIVLLYKGEPVLSKVEWHVIGAPSGVVTASIDRVNGVNRFIYTGLPPKTNYIFDVIASVKKSGGSMVDVPLTIQIYNSAAIPSFN